MITIAELEAFEQQLEGAIGEFQIISASESRLRDIILAECTKAEAAGAVRDYSNRKAAEEQSNAVAAEAAAAQAIATLAKVQEENTTLKMQLELMENQKKLLEQSCAEKSLQISTMEKDLQKITAHQSVFPNLQQKYFELQERVRSMDEEVHKQVSKIEEEFNRVQRCANSGLEIRERAQLAAAVHTRDRHLTTAELQLTAKKLLEANSEILRLKCIVATLEERVTRKSDVNISKTDNNVDYTNELQDALKCERAGAALLESYLIASEANNKKLAALQHEAEQPRSSVSDQPISDNLCPIDSLLAQ